MYSYYYYYKADDRLYEKKKKNTRSKLTSSSVIGSLYTLRTVKYDNSIAKNNNTLNMLSKKQLVMSVEDFRKYRNSKNSTFFLTFHKCFFDKKTTPQSTQLFL